MKFVQASDFHVGKARSIPGYLERHSNVLYQIADYCIANSLPLLLPGDIYDRKPLFKETLLVEGWLNYLEQNGVRTIVSPGNHEHIAGSEFLLDNLPLFPLRHVSVTGYNPDHFAHQDTLVITIPWGGYKEQEIRLFVETELAKASSLGNLREFTVVMCHECIVGSKVDNGTIMPKGCRLPDMPEVTYWAVGDIHVFQPTNLRNGFFAGAPLQFNFDEQEEKGFLVVDTLNPTEPEFVRTSFKPLRTVNSVDSVCNDAFYFVKGDIDEVLKANRNGDVIRTDWAIEARQAIDFKPAGVTDGLADYLALNGFDSSYQQRGITWVQARLGTGS